MSYNWTPLHIHLLLHYHTSNEAFYRLSIASSEYTLELLDMKLIKESGIPHDQAGYSTTTTGKGLVAQILGLPKPDSPSFIIIKNCPNGERLYYSQNNAWCSSHEDVYTYHSRPRNLPSDAKLLEIS